MPRVRHTIALLCAAAMLCGCGSQGDPGTPNEGGAYDLEGFWVMRQAVGMDGAGADVVVTDDGYPNAVVGDADFAAHDAESGTWSMRTILLFENLPVYPGEGNFSRQAWEVTLSDGVWTMNDGPLQFSYAMTLEGDRLSLRLDEHADDMVYERSEPMATRTLGTWVYTSLDHTGYGNGIQPGQCVPFSDGTRWYQVEFGWELADDHSGDLTHAVHFFSDDQCTSALSDYDGSSLMHLREWDESISLYHTGGRDDFDISAGSDGLTLTWTGCQPTPDCERDHFTTIELGPSG